MALPLAAETVQDDRLPDPLLAWVLPSGEVEVAVFPQLHLVAESVAEAQRMAEEANAILALRWL